MATVSRTLTLFTMHGHVGDQPLDYQAFFDWITTFPTSATVGKATKELRFSIDKVDERDGLFMLRVIASSPDEEPLYFNYRTGRTSTGSVPDGNWLSRTARITIDPTGDRRSVVIENSRSGVTAFSFARYLERFARDQGWANNLSFELTPVPSPSLLDEIDAFERIREASATVIRPNIGWDDIDDRLAELAGDSGGQRAEAVVRAPRGQSLNKTSGIMKIIRDSLGLKTPSVDAFRVTGRKQGSSKEVSVTSDKHQIRGFVDVDVDGPLTTSDDAVFNATRELARGREELDEGREET